MTENRVDIFHNTDKQNVDILFNNIQKCRVDLLKLLNNNVQNKIKDDDLVKIAESLSLNIKAFSTKSK